MNHMTVYLKDKVLNQELQGVYVGLLNGETEISKPSYERQSTELTPSSNGQRSNNADIFFPIAQESWGEITHIAIFDASSGGNMLFVNKAEFVKTIDISSQYKIPKNYLIARLR